MLTRATFAGGQRYGFTWTGDNSSTWGHLRLATQMLLNLGLSGISFVGDDIGGFGGSPPADLLTRWVEVGAFNPMYRNHSTLGSLPQELWVHGAEQEDIRRRYVETRYRLLPYIYTLAEEASRTGLPLVRPMFLEFPGDFQGIESQFLLGPSMLVAPPPFGESVEGYSVAYPEGAWYDFWTGRKMPPQPRRQTIDDLSNAFSGEENQPKFPEPEVLHPALDHLPVYVRGGTVLPMQPLIQSTEETPVGPLELRVYPGPNCNGSLYLDDGHTFRYRSGEFLRQAFTCDSNGKSVSVGFDAREGSYSPWWKQIEIVIYDWPSERAEAKFSSDAGPLKTSYDTATHALHVMVPDSKEKRELRIQQ